MVSPPHHTSHSHSSYYSNTNTNLASTYSTPPTRSDTLPPGPGIAISSASALPDTSHSLRPYALASSSSSSSATSQQQQQGQGQGQYQQQLQYRSGGVGGGGGTTGSPIPPPLGYPSRHQSPLAVAQQQQQMYAYSPQRGEDSYSQGIGGARPMSIDGRPSSSSMGGIPPSVAPPQPPQQSQSQLALPQGFRRVRGPGDLNPRVNTQPSDRRADPAGNGFLSVSFILRPFRHLVWSSFGFRPLFEGHSSLYYLRIRRKLVWLMDADRMLISISLSPRNRSVLSSSNFHHFTISNTQYLHCNPQPQRNPQRNHEQPLKCLTTNLAQTYNICNPQFRYETAHNPRRVLTKPSKPAHNDGYDNEDYDYILYVNDCLGTEEGQK